MDSLPVVPASSFSAAARSFSTSTPLGVEVHRAGGVDLDVDGAAAQAHLHRRGGGEAVVGRGELREPGHRGGEPGQVRVFEPDVAGGDLLPVLETLVAAEATDLGDEPLQVGDALRGGCVSCIGCVGFDRLRPVRDHHALAVGEGLPQGVGDERHHRVQQPQQPVEHGAEHGAGPRGGVVCEAAVVLEAGRWAAIWIFASSRIPSHTSSQVK